MTVRRTKVHVLRPAGVSFPPVCNTEWSREGVLAEGPSVYYRHNELSGSVLADMSGHPGFQGTLVGVPGAYGGAEARADTGTAICYGDPLDITALSYATVPAAAFNVGNGSWSIETFLKITFMNNFTSPQVFTWQNGVTRIGRVGINGGTFQMFILDWLGGGVTFNVFYDFNAVPKPWAYCRWTYDAPTLTLSACMTDLNTNVTQSDSVVAASFVPLSTTACYLGSLGGASPGANYRGWIDEFALYDHVIG